MDTRQKILSAVKSAVLEVAPDARIILFGSRSRNDFSKTSDWDFLVLTKTEATADLKKDIRSQLYDVELRTNQAISTIIHSKKEWQKFEVTGLYKEIEKDGLSV